MTSQEKKNKQEKSASILAEISSGLKDGLSVNLAGKNINIKRLELRAGLLLLLTGFLLIFAFLYLMWIRGVFIPNHTLYLLTDDSEGVSVGMDMTFSGFPIGRVSQIELAEEGEVRIKVLIPETQVKWLKKSSVFTLEKGLVGGAKLRAFTGMLEDDSLEDNAVREVLRGDVTAEIPRMVADARDVLQNVNRLTSPDSEVAILLTELKKFTGKLNNHKGGAIAALTGNEQDTKRLSELFTKTNELMNQFIDLSKKINTVVAKADNRILGQNDNDKGMLGDAQKTILQVNELLSNLKTSMEKVDNILKDAKVISENAKDASVDLVDLRSDVESNLQKTENLLNELNQKWPFAPKENEVKLP